MNEDEYTQLGVAEVILERVLSEAEEVDHAKIIAKSLAATHPNFRISSYDGDYGRAHVVHHKSDTRNFRNGEELMGPNIQLQHNRETNKVHMEMQGDFDNVPDRDEETHHPDQALVAAHQMFQPAVNLINNTDKLKGMDEEYDSEEYNQEEVLEEGEGTLAVTPKEKQLAAHHGDPKRITQGDVLKARLKSIAAKKKG
jgi:hypothetical protein